MRKRWEYLKHNVFQFLLAVDQLLNTLLFLSLPFVVKTLDFSQGMKQRLKFNRK